MAWRKVTESDLESALSGAEIEAFRRSATEADPVASQISACVAYVRGIVRSSPVHVRMNADAATLPESLVGPAMNYLRFGILTRMDVPVNESRRLAYEKSEELFEKVRRGEFVPESDGEEPGSGEVAGSPAVGQVRPAHLLD